MIKINVKVTEQTDGLALQITNKGKGGVSVIEKLHAAVIEKHIHNASKELQGMADDSNSLLEFTAAVVATTDCGDPQCRGHADAREILAELKADEKAAGDVSPLETLLSELPSDMRAALRTYQDVILGSIADSNRTATEPTV